MSIKRFSVMMFAVISIALTCTAEKTPDVKSLFPDIEGFTRSNDIVSYRPDNLFEYINGAAELYLMYDFSGLNLQQYKDKDENTITIEIYDQKTVNNSFGIYSQERPYECEYLDIGVQATYMEGYLNFYQGRYYVKIAGYNLGAKDREYLTSTAKKVSGLLREETTPPAMLMLFPEKAKVANREEYIPKDFLGYSFFEKAFTAEYQDTGAKSYKLFIIETPDRAALEKSIEEYKKAANIKIDLLKDGIHEVDDQYQGKLLISVKGKYIVGALNPENVKIDQSIIIQVISSLK
ncbi:MAG: hypothetical protein JW927_19505 [Deltaproteobacteria bacterium]|nr:hypothetical protein [Deltaproteobacteria bacterium]